MYRKLRTRVKAGSATPTIDDEPQLTVRPRPKPFFRRRRFLRVFAPASALAVAGLIALLMSGNLLLPFERVVTLEGKMGSKADFFQDEQVRNILLRHHLRVHVTTMGSRDTVPAVALDSTDFVFPSGRPAVELILQRLQKAKHYNTEHKPFVSPLVLATFRGYAETLERNGIARPQPSKSNGKSYYYDLNLTRFLDLQRKQTTWDDLNVGLSGLSNRNQVTAQTTNICNSNGAATYLALVSYATFGRVPLNDQEATDFALKVRPLLRAQGLPESNPTGMYFAPEGRQSDPIIVMYEHQYLAYQLRFIERSGQLDQDRVLLYPDMGHLTQPELIALNENSDRLGNLISTDPELRQRAVELGLRVLDPTYQLPKFLVERRVPVPSPSSDTRALLPDALLLEKMISVVGDCRPLE